MKRVSIKAAKTLKEAGYPQDSKTIYELGEEYDPEEDAYFSFGIAKPTYIEVWLWLWREKKINVTPEYDQISGLFSSCGFSEREDPEEVIEAAIEFLVNNSNLIKQYYES